MSPLTIEQALRLGAAQIQGESPALDAQLLLGAVTGRSRSSLFAWSDQPLTDAQAADYQRLLERRCAGEPVAHLTGKREFWSLPLSVSQATLIPRPDTECLVEQALALDLPAAARVLDLGTGTGAIALALASERPLWRITATDRSPAAVELARANARELDLQRVDVRASDWFSDIVGPFDLIVSNPPYIPRQDPHLTRGDVRFEPLTALVAGEDGLDDLRVIIDQARDFLAAGGWLLVEHGYDQAESVADLLAEAGYSGIGLRRDYGGQPRVSQGQWPGPDKENVG